MSTDDVKNDLTRSETTHSCCFVKPLFLSVPKWYSWNSWYVFYEIRFRKQTRLNRNSHNPSPSNWFQFPSLVPQTTFFVLGSLLHSLCKNFNVHQTRLFSFSRFFRFAIFVVCFRKMNSRLENYLRWKASRRSQTSDHRVVV